jgi:hypothetical protein
MPDIATLPQDIAPLAHRNAVEVRQEEWDLDVEQLASALRETAPRAVPTGPASGRSRWVAAAVAGACVAALLIGVVAWAPWATDDPDSANGDETSGNGQTSDEPVPAGNLEIPEAARTMLHLSGEAIEVAVESGSVGDPEGIVALQLRIDNHGSHDAALAPSDLQLVADGLAVNPSQTDGVYLTARTTTDVARDSAVDGEPTDLVLLIHHWDQEARIPLAGPSVVPAQPPEVTSEPETVTFGDVTITMGPASIEALSDRFLVYVPITLDNRGRYPVGLFGDALRLLVDGASTAPVEYVNEAVEPRSTAEATFAWEAPLDAEELILSIDYQGVTEEVPLT